MATLNRGYTFGATEQVTAAKLHALVDGGSVSNIIGNDISNNTITNEKIVSVSGAKFINLADIPVGAGDIPKANIDGCWDTDGTLSSNSDDKIPTQKAVKTYADTKISKTTSGELYGLTEKNSLSDDDLFLIEDSDSSYAKKKVKKSNLPSGFTNIQVFTSSGTFIKPAGVSKVLVEVVGGGGGGAGGSDNIGGGGGGGGGGYCLLICTITSNVSVTVGSGGAGGGSNSNGQTGGTSYFGSYCSATGGEGGYSPSNGRKGGNGGTGSGGNLNCKGDCGDNGLISYEVGGNGGCSHYGGGGRGSITNGGLTGGNYGGGGGGGGGNYGGGNGASGVVIVYY